MTAQISLFAKKLRAWRTNNGVHGRLTQEGLAELLGVSAEAISKYERSASFIRGDLEPRLSERLGWTQSEITACREDWDLRQKSLPERHYRVLDDALLESLFQGSWAKAVERKLALANRHFAGLPVELAAVDEVFGPIYTQHFDQSRMILKGDEVVSGWDVLILFPEHEALFRQGRLIETQIQPDDVRQPILPGTYFCYCPAVVVAPGHEASSPLLLSSFVSFLEGLAARDILFHSIGATAVSRGGAQLCCDLGMQRIGSHVALPDYGIWEFSGAALARSIFAQRSPYIKRRYTDAFGR